MPLRTTWRNLTAGIATLLAICIFSGLGAEKAQAQIPDLVVTIGDTVGTPGEQNSVISVYLTNTSHEVVAFELWIRVGRLDLFKFQTDTVPLVDTTYWDCTQYSGPNCIDSTGVQQNQPYDFIHVDTVQAVVGSVDTAGTAVSGWDKIDARSITGDPFDIKVTGFKNLTGPTLPGLPPNNNPRLLFRLLADINYIPDTMTDRTGQIFVDPFLTHFSFSDPEGNSIGLTQVQVIDTSYYRCTAWLPPDNQVCLNYQKVPGAPYDSMKVDTFFTPILDTNEVKLFDGSLTVLEGGCGNVDGSPDGGVDISDLTILIDHLFISNNPLPNEGAANVDCQGGVDISDLTVMIDHLFINNNPFCCSP